MEQVISIFFLYWHFIAKEEFSFNPSEKVFNSTDIWHFLKKSSLEINFQTDEVLLHERLGGGGSGAFVSYKIIEIYFFRYTDAQ